jgi:hypothetical protein
MRARVSTVALPPPNSARESSLCDLQPERPGATSWVCVEEPVEDRAGDPEADERAEERRSEPATGHGPIIVAVLTSENRLQSIGA